MGMNKPHILAQAAEMVLSNLKSKLIFVFKTKISLVQCERKTFPPVPLPVN